MIPFANIQSLSKSMRMTKPSGRRQEKIPNLRLRILINYEIMQRACLTIPSCNLYLRQRVRGFIR